MLHPVDRHRLALRSFQNRNQQIRPKTHPGLVRCRTRNHTRESSAQMSNMRLLLASLWSFWLFYNLRYRRGFAVTNGTRLRLIAQGESHMPYDPRQGRKGTRLRECSTQYV